MKQNHFMIINCVRKAQYLLDAYQNSEKGLLASSCPSARPYVCQHRITRPPVNGFSRNLIFESFRKSFEYIPVLLKSDKGNGYCTWRHIYIFMISGRILLRTENVSHKSCRGKQNTFYIQDPFSRKSRRLWQYNRDRQATDDNIMRRRKDEIFMPDN
jgi:hypothetical protein